MISAYSRDLRERRMGLQALLHLATAACARQGPSGPDQVRMWRFLVGHSTHSMLYQPRTESNDLVCRLNYGSQLQPVRGRDLRDRIRSGCDDVSFDIQCIAYFFSHALMQMIWSAGSTTGANCSLCEAGTFGTGSGQGALIAISNLHERYQL